MITNFAAITIELSEEEMKLLPSLIKGLKLRTKENPILEPEIVAGMRAHIFKHGNKTSFTGARLRKMCNYIRSNAILPLIAASGGYYCSTDTDEIIKQIASLTQRASAIMRSAEGLEKYLQNNLINTLPLNKN